MKTLNEIMNQETFVAIGGWSNMIECLERFSGTYITLKSGYAIDKELLKYENAKLLFSSHTQEWYDGVVFILFAHDGELYEVNTSYCSVDELEDLFRPEKVMLEELKYRLINGSFGVDEWYFDDEAKSIFNKELRDFLGIKEGNRYLKD
jgi:hypothetical protein